MPPGEPSTTNGKPARPRTFKSGGATKGTELVKVNETWDDLSQAEQLEIIREFCVEKLRLYGMNVGQWGHCLEEKSPRGIQRGASCPLRWPIVARTVQFSFMSYTIIGVLPPEFQMANKEQVFAP